MCNNCFWVPLCVTLKYALFSESFRDSYYFHGSRCWPVIWEDILSVLNGPLQLFILPKGFSVFVLLSYLSMSHDWQKRQDILTTFLLFGWRWVSCTLRGTSNFLFNEKERFLGLGSYMWMLFDVMALSESEIVRKKHKKCNDGKEHEILVWRFWNIVYDLSSLKKVNVLFHLVKRSLLLNFQMFLNVINDNVENDNVTYSNI